MGVVSPVAFASAASCARRCRAIASMRSAHARFATAFPKIEKNDMPSAFVAPSSTQAVRSPAQEALIESVGGELRDLLLGPALELAGSGMRPHP